MAKIHPTAIVDPLAEIADDAEVRAYAIIRGKVSIAAGAIIHEHTHIHGSTLIGAGCRIGPGSFVGLDPQHLKYAGEETWLIVGAENTTIREAATVHRSFKTGQENATRLGERCFIMGGVHIGHDCKLGNDVVMANNAAIGGHCEIGDRAFLGGLTGLHQFVRVGRLAILAGQEGSSFDVPPFAAVRYHGLKGYNAIGCRRAGFSREAIHAVRAAYHCLHTIRKTSDAVAAIQSTVPLLPEVQELLTFISQTKRGVMASVHFLNKLHSMQDGGDE